MPEKINCPNCGWIMLPRSENRDGTTNYSCTNRAGCGAMIRL